MNCDQARTEIIAYLKDELSGERKEKLEEHLARCPMCRHELEGARRLLSWTEAASEQAVVELVEAIIDDAIKVNASDIHFEPRRDGTLMVRRRVDGVMHEVIRVDSMQRHGVIARIKMMAGMDTAETAIPQDGRMPWQLDDRGYDLRVACAPYIFGENIVMRILDQSAPLLGLDKLYFYPDDLKILRKAIGQPMGMIICSGPTGSGKTTTLYSMLLELNTPNRKVMTIEDPVEYAIEGISHSQVHKKVGYTFASALRSMLRQDPDIIMVGEMRDFDTASIAIEAAITGHMVLTTLHTESSIQVIQRLRDMGTENFLIGASLLVAMSQRLVRKPCHACKEIVKPDSALLKPLGITPDDLKEHQIYRGAGCQVCRNTGYWGRVALYEILDVDNELRSMIGNGAATDEIADVAKAKGFRTLKDDARRKVLDGLTTPEEALRVLALYY